jgi:hypothetical protein
LKLGRRKTLIKSEHFLRHDLAEIVLGYRGQSKRGVANFNSNTRGVASVRFSFAFSSLNAVYGDLSRTNVVSSIFEEPCGAKSRSEASGSCDVGRGGLVKTAILSIVASVSVEIS